MDLFKGGVQTLHVICTRRSDYKIAVFSRLKNLGELPDVHPAQRYTCLKANQ